MKALTLWLACALLLTSCGSGVDFKIDFAGTYTGLYVSTSNGSSAPDNGTMKLTQDGSKIGGTFTTSSGDTGTFSGTASGRDIILFTVIFANSLSGCTTKNILFVGNATLHKDGTFYWTAAGSATCGGVSVDIDLTAAGFTKQ